MAKTTGTIKLDCDPFFHPLYFLLAQKAKLNKDAMKGEMTVKISVTPAKPVRPGKR